MEAADGMPRRAAQTTIYRILNTITRMLAPILAFTSEEIWSFMPHTDGEDARSVLLNDIPMPNVVKDEAFEAKWDRIHAIRDDVQKALEAARNEKLIGSSLDAKVTLYANGDLLEFVKSVEDLLPTVLIVSQVVIAGEGEGAFRGEVEGLSVSVAHADGQKCCRCWTYSENVVEDAEHDVLCARCAALMNV